MNKLHAFGLGVLGLSAALTIASCGEEPAKPAPAPAPARAPAPTPIPTPTPTSPAPAQPEPTAPQPTAPATTPATSSTAQPPTSDRPSYTVRGEIVMLPGIESSVLKLHHERIPTFANREGKIPNDSQGKPGMKPMTMGFSRGNNVTFDGLKAGDKIEIDFFVNWERLGHDDNIVITRLVKLAPETKLDFEGQPSVSDPKAAPKPEPK